MVEFFWGFRLLFDGPLILSLMCFLTVHLLLLVLDLFRVGFLYGRFNEDTSVKVEVIYEPPQETTDSTFTLLQDSKEVFVVLMLLM